MLRLFPLRPQLMNVESYKYQATHVTHGGLCSQFLLISIFCHWRVRSQKKDRNKKVQNDSILFSFNHLIHPNHITHTSTMSATEPAFNRPALEQLLGKRFFYAPAFSLYGGNFLFFFLVAWFKRRL